MIFVLEAFFKIIAYDIRYFKKNWLRFDFIIAIGSLIGLILDLLNIFDVNATSVFRAFRLLKLFWLFKDLKSLRIIAETFLVTLPAIANAGGLLLLLVYIFAILSMNVFAEILITDTLTPNMNFQTIGNSILTLFIMSTGDSFYEI
jgi:hypothetical protein